ncbi:MAG: hypothetical protein ACI8TX_002311 [Hyphomicrobiaceae bacterium]|jgi:hypothetical protein
MALAGDVVAAGFDPMTALYTNRQTVRPFVLRPLSMYYGKEGSPIGDVDELFEIIDLHNARYLLLSPLPGYTVEYAFFELVYAALDTRPGRLRPVWQLPENLRFAIFEVRPLQVN